MAGGDCGGRGELFGNDADLCRSRRRQCRAASMAGLASATSTSQHPSGRGSRGGSGTACGRSVQRVRGAGVPAGPQGEGGQASTVAMGPDLFRLKRARARPNPQHLDGVEALPGREIGAC
jgi:hypothetical protein